MKPAVVATPMLAAVTIAASACGSSGHAPASRQAIADAKQAKGFAQYSDIFPSKAETAPCSVGAGPPGHIFKGRCSAAVAATANRSAIVTFTQDFGASGRYRWRIRVSADRTPSLISQSGRGLVQMIR